MRRVLVVIATAAAVRLGRPTAPRTFLRRQGQCTRRQKAARARSAKAARSVFGPEVTESLEALQLVQRANLTVGVGRKNPNAMSNGRERRGKPRKKR